jgi:hypothetical protein
MTREEQENKRHNKTIKDQSTSRTLDKRWVKAILVKKIIFQHNIETKVTSGKVIKGWQGKVKGLLQVLCERGFIDMNNHQKYTMNGRQDACGVLMPKTYLIHLMSNCIDFEEEELLLQANGRELGVLVDRTPKCHC